MAGAGQDEEERGIRAGEEALLSAALDGLHELNERCLSLLQRTAVEHSGDLPRLLFPLISQFRKLEADAITGIAHQPFLLVDFAFGKPRVLRELMTTGSPLLRFPSPRGSFPELDAKAMVRGALLLAKNVCRHHPAHAGLLLGLDPSLQQVLAQIRLPDLEGIAEKYPHHLRLRWENRIDVWERLLAAGRDPDACHQFRMYGMQLIAGEMRPALREVR